mmetsp:Transcript_17628/g.70789  ORF Transcript_17628/g.70789 Transcript_17628/m.70789 type:complete len:84 (+) Transcript_17628:389-640(+)
MRSHEVDGPGRLVIDVTATSPRAPFGALFETRVEITLLRMTSAPPVLRCASRVAWTSSRRRLGFIAARVEGGAARGVGAGVQP